MSEKTSSQLDTLETSVILRPPESYRKYCVASCQDEMTATEQLYRSFDLDNSSGRLKHLSECRTGAWFARNVKTGKVRILSSSCKLRWCPMCSATRRWFLSQQVSGWLRSARQPKFLTLTLAHSNNPLNEQLNRLYQCFSRYRKLNLLRQNVVGGVWFFQIHKSSNDGLWHPHLHTVIDSNWIDKRALSAAWKRVTVTSEIICIKQVRDPETMSEYVARYAARPSMLSDLESADRIDLAESLHGRRLVGTWGSARSISLRPSKPPDADDWENVGSYAIVSSQLRTDDRAHAIWSAFKNDTPCPADCHFREEERFLDDCFIITPQTVEDSYNALLDWW